MFPSGGLLWFMNRSKTERRVSAGSMVLEKEKNLSRSLILRKFFFSFKLRLMLSSYARKSLWMIIESASSHYYSDSQAALKVLASTTISGPVNDSDKVVVSSCERGGEREAPLTRRTAEKDHNRWQDNNASYNQHFSNKETTFGGRFLISILLPRIRGIKSWPFTKSVIFKA